MGTFTKSEYPDEMPQNTFHLGLHSLLEQIHVHVK